MNASTDTAAVPAAAASTAGEDEVFHLSIHLIDRSVLAEIERVQAAKSDDKIVWPAQLVVRIDESSLRLEDATAEATADVCALTTSDSDFAWICAYLRLLHRCTAPRIIEARPPASASALAVV